MWRSWVGVSPPARRLPSPRLAKAVLALSRLLRWDGKRRQSLFLVQDTRSTQFSVEALIHTPLLLALLRVPVCVLYIATGARVFFFSVGHIYFCDGADATAPAQARAEASIEVSVFHDLGGVPQVLLCATANFEFRCRLCTSPRSLDLLLYAALYMRPL